MTPQGTPPQRPEPAVQPRTPNHPDRAVQDWAQNRRPAEPVRTPPAGALRPDLPSGPPPVVNAPQNENRALVDPTRQPPSGYAVMDPQGVQPNPVVPGPAQAYTVQAGDTLSGIAQKFYPGRMREGLKLLGEANTRLFSDPRKMRVGMVLSVPDLGTVQAAAPAPAQPRVEAAPVPPTAANTLPQPALGTTYEVQAGDSLEGIARKLFNDARRWRDLFEWNRDRIHDPGLLRVGQKLRIRPNDRAANPPAEETPRSEPKPEPVKKKTTLVMTPEAVEAQDEARNAAKGEASPAVPVPASRKENSGIWMP
ncbi:MAG: LysM peptidoglycan-binding domain-containing protein [Planctomycetota bacterium]|nr:LysM peptidoglycan-binding domain-containing protein [Planctomycetota bacterium]